MLISLAAALVWDLTVGAATSTRDAYPPVAPVLSLRMAADWPTAAAAVRALAILGPEGNWDWDHPERNEDGFRAWGLLAEGELHHSPTTPVQGFVSAGVGVGRLERLSAAQRGFPYPLAFEGEVGPIFRGGLGVRVATSQRVRIGFEASVLAFTRVEHGVTDPYFGPTPEGPGVLGVLLFLVRLEWAR